MADRTTQYASLALKVAYEKMSHWARAPFLSAEKRARSYEKMEDEVAESIFQSLAQLRGTAAKLGQALSLEHGLLPERYRSRLAALQHEVTPLAYAMVRKVIERDLGRPPEGIFREFTPQAFAAASLGQVHRAVLPSGEAVAVKVLYPGAAASIEQDFQLARALLAPLPQNRLLVRTLEEMKTHISQETDYRLERDQLARFAARASAVDGLVVPRVYAEYCGPGVLTTELLAGAPFTSAGPQTPSDRSRAAQVIYDFFHKSVFEWGAVHADPHPGNYLWLPEQKKVGVVDFGVVRENFSPAVLALFRAFFELGEVDPDEMLNLYEQLGADVPVRGQAERSEFFEQLVRPYREKVREFAHRGASAPPPGDSLARDLRIALLAHAFHPRLQQFSGEFSLLHRALYGTVNLMSGVG